MILVQEIRVVYPEKSITLIHSHKELLNPNAPPKTASGVRSYGSPPNTPKLSKNVETLLRNQKIDLVLGEKVEIPQGASTVGEWDGTPGAQGGVKKITLASGRTIEADWVFVSIGNKANSELVQEADPGALVDGMGKMVDVDDYLKVIPLPRNHVITRIPYADLYSRSDPLLRDPRLLENTMLSVT